MKLYKNIISLSLVVLLVCLSTTGFAKSGNEQFATMKVNLEIEKQEILKDVYKQLKDQDKENMYYLFEEEVEREFFDILESKFPLETEETFSITPLSSITKKYTFKNSGDVVYKHASFANTTINKMFLNKTQAQKFFNKTKTNNVALVADIVMLFIPGPWGKNLGATGIAKTAINNSMWKKFKLDLGKL